MAKPLFEPDEENDDDSDYYSDDSGSGPKKKGVKWDAGVVDHKRGKLANHKTNMLTGKHHNTSVTSAGT